jgi:uncharacterized delta-60 repeat protein
LDNVSGYKLNRLNADGTLDTGFNPSANNDVLSIVLQADGKILLGGRFTTIGGVQRNYIARVNPNGSLDTFFNPSADYVVESIALQPDAKILVAGDFTTIAGQTRNYIARFNADGKRPIVDFDGDRKADIALYRQSIGAWYIVPSSTGVYYAVGFGGDPSDIPITSNRASY